MQYVSSKILGSWSVSRVPLGHMNQLTYIFATCISGILDSKDIGRSIDLDG
jgi:hypothetical protein